MWSNCGESCPSNYQLMKRTDDMAREGEWMFDESGCNGAGVHRLCCPAQETLPQCGWWHLPRRGGSCKSSCPQGYTEIGSNSKYCDSGYQAACCKLTDDASKPIRAMELYGNCNWALADQCALGKCSPPNSKLLVESSTGSGGAVCRLVLSEPRQALRGSRGPRKSEERKYCCSEGAENRKWSNCEWYSRLGQGQAGQSCLSGCPSGKVRVAMDSGHNHCATGARSFCCDAESYDIEDRESPEIKAYRTAMEAWLKQPTCPNKDRPFVIFKREEVYGGGDEKDDCVTQETKSLLSARDQKRLIYFLPDRRVLALLTAILATAWHESMTQHDKALRAVWDDKIKAISEVLASVPLLSFLTDKLRYPAFEEDGPEETAVKVLCKPHVYVSLIKPKSPGALVCGVEMCGVDGLCQNEDGENSPSNQRGLGLTSPIRRSFLSLDATENLSILEKRLEQLRFQCIDPSHPQGVSISWFKRPYISAGNWDAQDNIYDNALDRAFTQDCSNTALSLHVLPDGNPYCTEHILEMQTMAFFFTHAAKDSSCQVDCDFFLNGFRRPIVSNQPTVPGGFQSSYPSERIMDALGSEQNRQNFVLLGRELNELKKRVWELSSPVSDKKWQRLSTSDDAKLALQWIRDVIMIFNYLNNDFVRPKFEGINNILRDELQRASDAWNSQNIHKIDLRKCWDVWFPEHLGKMVEQAKKWLGESIESMRDHWNPAKRSDEDWKWISLQVNQHLDRLEAAVRKEVFISARV